MSDFNFTLPDIGEGVTEGEVVKWLVNVGDTVTEDQAIVEIMTDKATVEIASPVAGIIKSQGVAEGDMLQVGSTVSLIESTTKQSNPQSAPPAVEEPQKVVAMAPPTTSSVPSANDSLSTSILASPATRKLARENNLSLGQIQASGSNGRVLRDDVERMISGSTSTSSAAPALSTYKSPTQSSELEERIPLRGIRKIIAENMLNSKLSAAHFTHVDELDATALVKTRSMLKAEAESKGIKLTYLPFIIKAMCSALKEYPKLNASLDNQAQEIVVKNYFNIGIAVATKDDDLIVPVIHNADQKGLLELAHEIVVLADKARQNKLSPDNLKGGTFTLTSMGNKGGLMATPIINYPEVGIMGFHKIEDRAVVRNGEVVVRKMANVSVSIDHRIVDGVMGADFLMAFIRNLENPARMLL